MFDACVVKYVRRTTDAAVSMMIPVPGSFNTRHCSASHAILSRSAMKAQQLDEPRVANCCGTEVCRDCCSSLFSASPELLYLYFSQLSREKYYYKDVCSCETLQNLQISAT